MLKGQCLCGAVRYRYEAELTESIVCHCLDCQQAQGTAFAFNSPIDERLFVLDSGADALKEFFFTPNKARVFCRHCGSPMYSYRSDLPNVIRLRLGTVTQGHVPAPAQQFFTERCVNFVTIQLNGSSDLQQPR